MNKRMKLSRGLLAFSLALTACAGLISAEEEPIIGEYGPNYSTQEHQQRTFDALWDNLTGNYIYFKSSAIDWDGIYAEYSAQIEDGLSPEEFSALMVALEDDLPSGSFTYQSRQERIEADTEDASTYEGIGAFVGFVAENKPHIVVLGVIAGSPAEKAGIRAHDSIFAIDGSPVLLEEGLNVVERVRGPAGSTVILNVQTPGKPERSIEVTRGKLVSTGKVESRQIKDTSYGYILLPPISYDALLEDVLNALQAFTTNQKLEGLILDLRVAGSARGFPLEELLTLFQDGRVGEFYNNTNQSQLVSVNGQDVYSSQTVPLIVLVGQNTNGFPEILAASLQANGRATVVGENTPGAVETTTSFYLPDGSRIFVETTSFRLPNGDELGLSGVKPEVVVEAGWDEVIPGNDPVILQAIELLGVDE